MENPHLEYWGRAGIVLLISFIIEKTQWYQNLPFPLELHNISFDIIICLMGLMLSFIWVVIPLYESIKTR